MFHYLIYRDPDVHVRVRFKLTGKQRIGELFEYIANWCHSLIREGFIDRLVYDTYQRELERYGGANFINSVEKVFFFDSTATIKTLNLFSIKKTTSEDSDIIKYFTIIDFMNKLGVNYSSQRKLLRCYFDSEKNRQQFKEDRIKAKSHIRELAGLYLKRKSNPSIYRDKIPNFYNNSMNWCTVNLSDSQVKGFVQDHLLLSLIHMHCNRLLINRNEEKKLCTY